RIPGVGDGLIVVSVDGLLKCLCHLHDTSLLLSNIGTVIQNPVVASDNLRHILAYQAHTKFDQRYLALPGSFNALLFLRRKSKVGIIGEILDSLTAGNNRLVIVILACLGKVLRYP